MKNSIQFMLIEKQYKGEDIKIIIFNLWNVNLEY